MKKIDMSDMAVTRRLSQVEQLRRLSLELMKSKPRPRMTAVSQKSNEANLKEKDTSAKKE